MKAFLRLSQILFLSLFIVGCSSSDSDDPASGPAPAPTNPTNYDYFPNANGNTWDFDVANTDNTTSQTTNSNDVVTVNSQSGNNFTVDVSH